MLPHERLDEALNKRRLDKRMDWNEVAAELGISPESLRAIRKGRNGPSEKTARALDDWLDWQHGRVELLFAGDDDAAARTAELILKEMIEEDVTERGGTISLTVIVNEDDDDEPEPDEPPGGFLTQTERVIWALTDYPWQLRWAQIRAGREFEAARRERDLRAASQGD